MSRCGHSNHYRREAALALRPGTRTTNTKRFPRRGVWRHVREADVGQISRISFGCQDAELFAD